MYGQGSPVQKLEQCLFVFNPNKDKFVLLGRNRIYFSIIQNTWIVVGIYKHHSLSHRCLFLEWFVIYESIYKCTNNNWDNQILNVNFLLNRIFWIVDNRNRKYKDGWSLHLQDFIPARPVISLRQDKGKYNKWQYQIYLWLFLNYLLNLMGYGEDNRNREYRPLRSIPTAIVSYAVTSRLYSMTGQR
jgi:hypothetical protein